MGKMAKMTFERKFLKGTLKGITMRDSITFPVSLMGTYIDRYSGNKVFAGIGGSKYSVRVIEVEPMEDKL